MSRKRKVQAETAEMIDQSFTNLTTNRASNHESQSSEENIKKRKRKKDNIDPTSNAEVVALENMSNEQDALVNCKSDENVAKKKQKKKNRTKPLENDAEAIETKDFSVSTADQELGEANENSKNRKKRKKEKETKQEMDVDVKSEETHENEATKAIGTVDTDILKQASVNLGLPLADHESNDAQVQATQKKANKKQLKKDKDKQKTTSVSKSEAGDSNPDVEALSYLRLWQSNRNAWKFNKRLQIKLIHKMYSKDKLTDEDFEILLLYLDGLQGKSREKTKEEAGKIVTEDMQEIDEIKQERARQVFQMLS